MFIRISGTHQNVVKKVIFIITSIIIFGILCYYILGFTGIIYMKYDEGIKVYEFTDDLNMDGIKESVKFVNHYYSYSKKNTTDSEYTSNYIKLYLDGSELYNNMITTLGPLLNPKVVDVVDNINKRQIYVHSDGGGPAIPMDYYFYILNGKFAMSKKEAIFSN